jgi:hypothetical protein
VHFETASLACHFLLALPFLQAHLTSLPAPLLTCVTLAWPGMSVDGGCTLCPSVFKNRLCQRKVSSHSNPSGASRGEEVNKDVEDGHGGVDWSWTLSIRRPFVS